jgi:hypothetical protein
VWGYFVKSLYILEMNPRNPSTSNMKEYLTLFFDVRLEQNSARHQFFKKTEAHGATQQKVETDHGPIGPAHGQDRGEENSHDQAEINLQRGKIFFHLRFESCLQFAGFVHFHHDIAAANQFFIVVELRNGGPVAVLFNSLANVFVLQNVYGFEGNANFLQNRRRTG